MNAAIPARVVDWAEWAAMPLVRDLGRKPRVGEYVVLPSRGKRRLAVVTKVGRERVETAYMTPNAASEAERHGMPPVITRKPMRMDDDRLRFAGKSPELGMATK